MAILEFLTSLAAARRGPVLKGDQVLGGMDSSMDFALPCLMICTSYCEWKKSCTTWCQPLLPNTMRTLWRKFHAPGASVSCAARKSFYAHACCVSQNGSRANMATCL